MLVHRAVYGYIYLLLLHLSVAPHFHRSTSSQSTWLSSLCCAAASHYFHMAVHTHQSQSPNSSHSPFPYPSPHISSLQKRKELASIQSARYTVENVSQGQWSSSWRSARTWWTQWVLKSPRLEGWDGSSCPAKASSNAPLYDHNFCLHITKQDCLSAHL